MLTLFGRGALAEGVLPRGQLLWLRQGISVPFRRTFPAGELDPGMLRVRQAFRAESERWGYNPGC